MKNKKKSLKNVHILGKILQHQAQGPDTYIEDYIQPPGIRATCHGHLEPLGFKSIEDLQKHWREEHEGRQK
jgi:hypothetical protein